MHLFFYWEKGTFSKNKQMWKHDWNQQKQCDLITNISKPILHLSHLMGALRGSNHPHGHVWGWKMGVCDETPPEPGRPVLEPSCYQLPSSVNFTGIFCVPHHECSLLCGLRQAECAVWGITTQCRHPFLLTDFLEAPCRPQGSLPAPRQLDLL